MAPDMPVAVLERGTLSGSRAIKTLLADLGSMVDREKVASPAIIVVGEVVELSDAQDKLGRWARIAEIGCGGCVKLLTGNDLPTGDVIWWTGEGWSRHVEDAADVGDMGEVDRPRRGRCPPCQCRLCDRCDRDAVRASPARISRTASARSGPDGAARPDIEARRSGRGELGDLEMYKYDQYDQSIVDARVEEFRDQVKRRLAGQITEDQFKPLRLMNGLYLQLHA